MIASWLRVMRTDDVDSSGYITPTMSDGPSCVSTNCASGSRTDMLAPRRTW